MHQTIIVSSCLPGSGSGPVRANPDSSSPPRSSPNYTSNTDTSLLLDYVGCFRVFFLSIFLSPSLFDRMVFTR